MASITGTNGNDTLTGSADLNDTISGSGGDDRIDGGTGFNFMIGGGGNDTITGGTRGDSRPQFNDFNVASYKGATKEVTATLGVQGEKAVVGIVTGQGRDVLVNVDSLVLTEFNDTFKVTSLWTGSQFDPMDLNALVNQKVLVRTEGVFNEFRGSPGNDTIEGNGVTRIRYTDNKVDQSAGVKVTFTSEQAGTTQGVSDKGVAFTDSFTGVFAARGSSGPDTLLGSAGSQWFQATGGGDTISGGPGVDLVDFQPGATTGVSVNLGITSAQQVNSDFGSVVISGVEAVRGTLFSDTLVGNGEDNYFLPAEGNDSIDGGAGFDTVVVGDPKKFFSVSTDTSTGIVTLVDTRAPSSEPNEWRYGTNTLANIELIVFEDGSLSVESTSPAPQPTPGPAPVPTPTPTPSPTPIPSPSPTPTPSPTPGTGTNTLDVIVDLFGQVMYLKGLTETITSTSHTIQYSGTSFNYSEVDGFLTTVSRNGDFTDEFAKEIAEAFPSVAGITYSTAVALVGASAIEGVLISVAGADGNYVG